MASIIKTARKNKNGTTTIRWRVLYYDSDGKKHSINGLTSEDEAKREQRQIEVEIETEKEIKREQRQPKIEVPGVKMLKLYRVSEGLSHRDMADRIGVSLSYYQQVESGRRMPQLIEAQKILAFLFDHKIRGLKKLMKEIT